MIPESPRPFVPQTDHDLIIEMATSLRRIEASVVGLEARMNVHVGDIDKRLDGLDDRLHLAERLLWALTWIGGPAWGIVLLILGAIAGAVAHSVWRIG